MLNKLTGFCTIFNRVGAIPERLISPDKMGFRHAQANKSDRTVEVLSGC